MASRAAELITRADLRAAEAQAKAWTEGKTDAQAQMEFFQTRSDYLAGVAVLLAEEIEKLRAPLQEEHFRSGRYWTVRQTGGAGYEVVAETEGRSAMRIAHSYSRYHAELLASGPRAMDLLQQFIDQTADKNSLLVRSARNCMAGPLSAKAGLEQIACEVRAAAPTVAEVA
jgi:hypothetical protein